MSDSKVGRDRPRFGVRVLIVLTLLVTSGVGFYWNYFYGFDPWHRVEYVDVFVNGKKEPLMVFQSSEGILAIVSDTTTLPGKLYLKDGSVHRVDPIHNVVYKGGYYDAIRFGRLWSKPSGNWGVDLERWAGLKSHDPVIRAEPGRLSFTHQSGDRWIVHL